MQLSTEEFVKRLPPIEKMVSEFHVPPDAAFFLSRPLYSYDVNVSDSWFCQIFFKTKIQKIVYTCSFRGLLSGKGL